MSGNVGRISLKEMPDYKIVSGERLPDRR